MKKILLLASILFIATQALMAGPIDENRAREIATAFFSVRATRSAACEVELEWAGRDITSPQASTFSAQTANTDNALLYIYNRCDKPGFVIIAGAECDTPIIAYSDKNCFDHENMAPSTRAILSAWSRQIEATKCNDMVKKDAAELAAESYGNVITSYDSALWNQMTPYNNECPKYDRDRSVTGCVATAMAIVCYHNRWPEKGEGTTPSYSYLDYYDNYRTVSSNTLGRTYNYDNMLHSYDDGYTNAQGNAVAALMYDLGTSVEMQYHYMASSAYSEDIADAMSTYFGYSKEACLLYRDRYTQSQWNQMIKENIDTYGPTIYTGVGDEGGHAFIVDGYTDKNYFHFNFGWSGSDNGYWKTPDIDFYKYQDAVFYLAPDKDGSTEYVYTLSLMSGSYGGSSHNGISLNTTTVNSYFPFNATVGCICNESNTTFAGKMALVVCNKNGEIKKIVQEQEWSGLQAYQLTTTSFNNATINETLEGGDVLRVMYKFNENDDWAWMKGSTPDVVDEIVLRELKRGIAESIALRYDAKYQGEDRRAIVINSQISVNYEWQSKSGSVLKAGKCDKSSTLVIELDSNTKGEYVLKFSNDKEIYSINITL